MIFDGKPSVVGHRGFGAGEPGGYRENTMPSYLAAVAHGLSWIELDVQRSLDGQLVIRHDPVTADGDFIVTRSADELAAGGIARLDDVLAGLPVPTRSASTTSLEYSRRSRAEEPAGTGTCPFRLKVLDGGAVTVPPRAQSWPPWAATDTGSHSRQVASRDS